MSLDEQLAMANSSVAMTPNQPAPVQASAEVQVAPQQVAQAQVVQPAVTTQVPPVSNPAPAPQVTGFDMNAAAQEAETNYQVGEIELGQKVSTRAIEPIKRLNQGEKFRFTLIATNPGFALVHNSEDLGKLLCWSTKTHQGQCCKDLDQPRARYYWPVVVYGTMPGDPNTPLPQVKSELRLLVIWDTATYDQLCSDIIARNKDITQLDFVATVTDTYGKLDIRPASNVFRNMPEYSNIINEATQTWASIKDKAPDTIGRKLDDERYIKLTQKAVVPQMQTYSMEDAMQ